MTAKGELSPDGGRYWDGRNWVSAVSPDGLWRWDGTRWVPHSLHESLKSSPTAPRLEAIRRPTNPLAVTSLIAGIAAFFLCPLVGGCVAVICGDIAHRQIGRTAEGGSGLAAAGLVLGYVNISLSVLFVLWLVSMGALGAFVEWIASGFH